MYTHHDLIHEAQVFISMQGKQHIVEMLLRLNVYFCILHKLCNILIRVGGNSFFCANMNLIRGALTSFGKDI